MECDRLDITLSGPKPLIAFPVVELGKRGKGGIGAAIAVGDHAGQVHTRGCHVSYAELHVSKIVVNTRRVTFDVTVAEILGEAGHRQQLDLVSRGQRFKIVLITLQVHYCVRSYVIGISARKKRLPSAVCGGGIYRHNRILEGQGNVGQRISKKAGCKRKGAGDEIVLPQVGNN